MSETPHAGDLVDRLSERWDPLSIEAAGVIKELVIRNYQLETALRGVIRESDRNTDAYIYARSLLATPDSAASPTDDAANRTA